MGLQYKLSGAGFTPLQANTFSDSVRDLTATGTVQADALQISSAFVGFSTVASGTGGRLPDEAQPGDFIFVYNGGANALAVYPPVGDKINEGTANASVPVNAGGLGIFVRVDSTKWSALSGSGLFTTLSLAAGTVAAPSLYLGGDTTTGHYRPAANQIGITVSGTQVGFWSSSGLTLSAGQFLAPNGTAAAPSISLTNATGSGMFFESGAGSGAYLMGGGTKLIRLTTVPVFGPNGLQFSAAVDFTNATSVLLLDSNNTLALRNGASSQELRVYGTTTGSKYTSIKHDGTNALIISTAGQIAFGSAALATNATVAFPCIQSCAGTPTGVPASIPTGQLPWIYDSTNNIIYIYNGAWKKTAALT